MNFNFYIIGTPEGRYSQYPEDYTAPTLAGLQENMIGARLVIYREMNLMHYVYTERLYKNNFIGFCLIFNNARITKPRELIKLFRFIIEKRLVESGNIIKYTEEGDLKFNVKNLNKCIDKYDRLNGYINSELENNLSKYGVEPLVTIYNGVKSTYEIDKNASNAQIISLTNRYNKVIVNDDEGIEHGYISQVIEVLRVQNEKSKKEVSKLLLENEYLYKQKKQYRYVVLAVFIILCCGLGLFFLYDDLDSTQEQLVEAKITINDKNNDIKRLNALRDSLKLCLIDEKQEKRELEKNLSAICTSVPFVITSCSINAEEVVVDYYAAEQKNVTVYLKAINESEPEIVSNSHSVTIYKGKNKLKLSFNYHLNPANYYYVNILYDGHVIGGRRW